MKNTLACLGLSLLTKKKWNIDVSNSYLETSGGQSSNPNLNVAHFFNTRVDKTSVAAEDSCFPVLLSNMSCSIV